jgi:hypothetical protein
MEFCQPVIEYMPIGRFELSIRHWTVLLACAAVVVYIQTVGYGFVLDDNVEVVWNAHVRSLAHLSSVFTSTAWAGAGLENHLYRPLTTASYALNYAFTGLAPWSYHLVNIALHALVTVLLFRLALWWGLALEAAGLGALLFAVHPIHVEVVANIAGRKDLLAATFMLAALFAHSQALRQGGIWMGMAPIAYGAAMFSKETGAVTIGLILLQDALVKRRVSWEAGHSRRTLLYAGYGLTLLAYLVVRWSVVGSFGIPKIPLLYNPAAHALVAPVSLSPDYSYEAIPLVESPMNADFLLTVLVIVGLAVAAVALRRTEPIVPFALGWYALVLLPTANFLFPIGIIFGERILYLPSMAFCLLAGYLLAKGLPKLRPALTSVLLLGVVVVLGLRTVTYAAAWKDELTLFTAAARVVPDSTRVHYYLGNVLMKNGRPEEAIKAFHRALTILPTNSDAARNLAFAYRKVGRVEAAREVWRQFLETGGVKHPEEGAQLRQKPPGAR